MTDLAQGPYTDAAIEAGGVVLHDHEHRGTHPWNGPYNLYKHATIDKLWSVRGPDVNTWIQQGDDGYPVIKQMLGSVAHLNAAWLSGRSSIGEGSTPPRVLTVEDIEKVFHLMGLSGSDIEREVMFQVRNYTL